MISKRYAKANNKYMEKYDLSIPSSYLPYLNANNLYGWSMCQKLPAGDFKPMSDSNLKNWENIPSILKVNLEYPKELHQSVKRLRKSKNFSRI